MKIKKKIISSIIIATVFTLSLTPSALGNATQESEIVPLKIIGISQGAEVKWDKNTSTASIRKGKKNLKVTNGKNKAIVNGKSINLKKSITCENGRMMVPLSVLNSTFGTKISFDDCLKILSVKYMECLQKEDTAECLAFFNKTLKRTVTPEVVKQQAAILKTAGNIKQESISSSKNGVHINVSIRYSSPTVGQFDYIIRFDSKGFIDDIMLKSVTPSDPYTAPEYDKSSSYTEKQVVIGSGDWKLPGTLTVPKGKGPFPVVVLVHGSGPNDRDETLGPLKPFRDIAVGLAAKNIATLRFEKRSSEHNLKFSLINKVAVKDETTDDAFIAANFLAKQKTIDPSKIYVLGHSQGGLLIPRIMTDKNSKVFKGAIIMSGPTRFLGDIMVQQYEYLMNLNMATKAQLDFMKTQNDLIKSNEFSPENPPQGYAMGTPYWWADIKAYNPIETAKKVTKPLLILQGERDYQVTAKEDYNGWMDALSERENITFNLYPKLNHMYTEGEGQSTPQEYFTKANVPIYVIDDIVKWVNTTMQ